MDPQVKRKAQFSGAYFLLAVAALLLVQSFVVERALGPRQVPYNEFLKALREGQLAEVQLRQADILAVKKAAGEARPERLVTSRLPGLDETALLSELQERQVPVWEPEQEPVPVRGPEQEPVPIRGRVMAPVVPAPEGLAWSELGLVNCCGVMA